MDYYLVVTITEERYEDELGAGVPLSSQTTTSHFYGVGDEGLASDLVTLFNRHLGGRSGYEGRFIDVRFDLKRATDIDTHDRFLIEEEIEALHQKVADYYFEWWTDQGLQVSYEDHTVISGSHLLKIKPPLKGESLSLDRLHDQASRWAENLGVDAARTAYPVDRSQPKRTTPGKKNARASASEATTNDPLPDGNIYEWIRMADDQVGPPRAPGPRPPLPLIFGALTTRLQEWCKRHGIESSPLEVFRHQLETGRTNHGAKELRDSFKKCRDIIVLMHAAHANSVEGKEQSATPSAATPEDHAAGQPALWFGDDYRPIKDHLKSRLDRDLPAAAHKAMLEADAMEAKGTIPFDRPGMAEDAVRPIREAFFAECAAERLKAEMREQVRDRSPEHLRARYKQYKSELLRVIEWMQNGYFQWEIDDARRSGPTRETPGLPSYETRMRAKAAAVLQVLRDKVLADLKREENDALARLEASECNVGSSRMQSETPPASDNATATSGS